MSFENQYDSAMIYKGVDSRICTLPQGRESTYPTVSFSNTKGGSNRSRFLELNIALEQGFPPIVLALNS